MTPRPDLDAIEADDTYFWSETIGEPTEQGVRDMVSGLVAYIRYLEAALRQIIAHGDADARDTARNALRTAASRPASFRPADLGFTSHDTETHTAVSPLVFPTRPDA